MSPLVSTIISLLFIIVGAVTFVIMIIELGGGHADSLTPNRATRMHRILGWVFVALYLTMTAAMVYRLTEYWEEWPSNVAMHVTLALALFVLLALKVSIPRRFPALSKHLFLLGTAVYLASFVLVWVTAGHFLIHLARGAPYISRSSIPTKLVDARLGKELFMTKCSTCHLLQDIMIPREYQDWESVVNRMVLYATPGIKPYEAALILNYVTTDIAPRVGSGAGGSPLDRYCSPCHNPEFIKSRNFDRNGWEKIVRRMSKRAPDIVPPVKITTIVDFLGQGNE